MLTYQSGPESSQVTFTLSQYQNVVAGNSVVMTASVQAQNYPSPYEPAFPVPTGTVQLTIDGTNVGSPVQLLTGSTSGFTPNGIATITIDTSKLSVGMHPLRLSYSGDSNYAPGSSGDVNLFIVVSDFSIALNPATLIVTNGQSTAPTSVQINYVNGFSGTTTFSCSGLPADSTCVFSPSSLANSGATSLSITTTQAQVVRAAKLDHTGQMDWQGWSWHCIDGICRALVSTGPAKKEWLRGGPRFDGALRWHVQLWGRGWFGRLWHYKSHSIQHDHVAYSNHNLSF